VPSEYESSHQPLIKKMCFGDSAPNNQASARRRCASTAPSGVVKMTMRPRPFAVFDHARLLSADVGLISLPEAFGGCYDD
jgi:hypothetical protein